MPTRMPSRHRPATRRAAGARARPRPRLPLLVGPGARSTRCRSRGAQGSLLLATTTARATSTSPRSWSTSTSATSTRSWSRRSRSRPAQLCTIQPSFANDARSEAARLIAEIGARATSNQVFFTNGGAEANENAIRLARLHTGRHKVLAAYRSYHGATAGAIALTGDPRRWGSRAGVMPGVVRYWGPYLYRSAFHADTTERGVRARAAAPARPDHGRGAAHGRRDHARDRRRHQRHPGAAGRLPRRACARSATSTAS